MIRKILIANRGEIAVRIIRACREMGISTVAVYSEADREALHTQLADEAVCIGEASPTSSYLNMENIISATINTGADAIHPGFGFLSENSRFAELCEECNIKFIGPSAKVIESLGNKTLAKSTMAAAGVSVVPGSTEAILDVETGIKVAEEIGYPVIIKAALGGGGKGMRIAERVEDFEGAFLAAQKESEMAFGDRRMYIERFIKNPRHIEIQVVADNYGNVVHLGERECSIQRNHQKLVEEAPASCVNSTLRNALGAMATRAAQAAKYTNVGTIEFLLDEDGSFYFMEMNTRIQVEHPVTEMITGIDLIKTQIKIAEGEPLWFTQDDVKLSGHAIECRINAEDPENSFFPCPGKIDYLHLPGGNGIRVDSGVYNSYVIPPYYDSMIAKLIVHGETRQEAINKMNSALGEIIVQGPKTNIDFQHEIINNEYFQRGDFDINFIDKLTT